MTADLTKPMPTAGDHIWFPALVAAIEHFLLAAGVAADGAAVIARNHAVCERDGAGSHGVFRVLQYPDTMRTGYLDGSATPHVEPVTSSYLRVDAAGGFAWFTQSFIGFSSVIGHPRSGRVRTARVLGSGDRRG